MACVLIGGAIQQEGERDENGHRTYTVVWQVQSDVTDGPANVMQTPGLPVPGTMWNYRADVDVWAWCRPQMKITAHPNDPQPNEPRYLWAVEQTFSTKPPSREQAQRQRPPDERNEDPLLWRPKVSGATINYAEEISYNNDGTLICTSVFEPIRGPQVEFDAHRSQVIIEQNVIALNLPTVEAMVNTVNDATLWGHPARFIKLSNFSWSWQYYGSAFRYYTRTFTFDIFGRYRPDTPGSPTSTFSYVSGHDRRIPDEGTMVLRGTWEKDRNLSTYNTYRIGRDALGNELTPDTAKAGDIVAFLDSNNNPANVILDGHGRPWDRNMVTTGTAADDQQGYLDIEHYFESNFLLLGIPTVL